MKNKKASSVDVNTLPLLQGGGNITFNKSIIPEFFFATYDHYESNVSIMMDGCKVFLGRDLNEQEQDTLRQVLLTMDGLTFLEITSVLELMFKFKKINEKYSLVI